MNTNILLYIHSLGQGWVWEVKQEKLQTNSELFLVLFQQWFRDIECLLGLKFCVRLNINIIFVILTMTHFTDEIN